jgi:hypothetical protein
VGLKLNGAYQIPVYANVINLFGDYIDTVKKYVGAVIDASKEEGQKVN